MIAIRYPGAQTPPECPEGCGRWDEVECEVCEGDGRDRLGDPCFACDGTGRVPGTCDCKEPFWEDDPRP